MPGYKRIISLQPLRKKKQKTSSPTYVGAGNFGARKTESLFWTSYKPKRNSVCGEGQGCRRFLGEMQEREKKKKKKKEGRIIKRKRKKGKTD